MKELNLVIQNETGLHARPAKELVNLAKRFQSQISMQYGNKKGNAKSMIGVLKLGVKKAGEIKFVIEGEDEVEAAAEIETAVLSGLGEGVEHNGHQQQVEEKRVAPAAPVLPENVIMGVPASPGVAIGSLFRLRRQTVTIEQRPFSTTPEELAQLTQAMAGAKDTIEATKANALENLSEEEAAIFEAHLSILADPDLKECAEQQIAAGVIAPQAWQTAVEEQANMLTQLPDPLLAGRAIDVRDVGQQVSRIFGGGEAGGTGFPDQPFILIADDLTPSETVALDRNKVLGFGTSAGGPTAHSAILARALCLPAVVGAGEQLLGFADGTAVILDGSTGKIVIEPTEAEVAAAEQKIEAMQKQREAEEAAAKDAATTQDGHRVEVVANIGDPKEAAPAYEIGAEGVGLLRTEFLFLGQDEPPAEEKQFEVYRHIVEAMQNQPVIIRTLDIGGDKPVPYIQVAHEENPFLGERGLRLCLNRPELFRTQLRAIVKAAKYGRVLIMFPMVSDVSEIHKARQLVDEVVAELEANPVEVGMMIEVPSAAIMADQFAPYVDFFSIGTNDLTQYTLAVDRQHPTLARMSDGLHPAVLRLIERTVQGAQTVGKWVGVCGELAADPQAVPILLGLGVAELSMNMNAIAAVKAQVRTLQLSEAKTLAKKALNCATAQEVRAITS